MAEFSQIDAAWFGRLVRVLIVFRTLVLLTTILLLPAHQRTPVVGLAAIVAALLSYVPLRHWERVASSISRHPAYLACEVALATLILAAAGARSPFFFFTLGTAVLAGIVYGRRGALPFSALLIVAYELVATEGFPRLQPLHDVQSIVFIPLLYPAAVFAGVIARELIEHGVQTETLLRERTEALAGEHERMRVARELHDSLAKTIEGLAMSASVLPRRCERDPAAAAVLARELAADASQAAREARGLMFDLRLGGADMSLAEAVRGRAQGFAQRAGIEVSCDCPEGVGDALDPDSRHELLRILGEALANATRHGSARRVSVSLADAGDRTVLSIADDGAGLGGPVDLAALKAAGHFGIAGMYERARRIGGSMSVEPAPDRGTVVTVQVSRSAVQNGSGQPRAAHAPESGGGWITLMRGLRGRRTLVGSPKVRS